MFGFDWLHDPCVGDYCSGRRHLRGPILPHRRCRLLPDAAADTVVAWFMGHIFTTAAWFSSHPRSAPNGRVHPNAGIGFRGPPVKLDAHWQDSWMNHNPFTLPLGDPPESSSWCGGADSPEDDQRWFSHAVSSIHASICSRLATRGPALVVLWTIFACVPCLFLLCAVCYEPGSVAMC